MAVKESITIRCDCPECKSIIDIESKSAITGNGWYRISVPDNAGRLSITANSFDFCSLKCVNVWSKARAVVMGEALTSRKIAYTKKPCPCCEAMIAPQGLRQHVVVNHPTEDFDTVRNLYNQVA